ncbi:hypothetical protein ACM614_00835 [Streptomyces sp. 12297]
MEAGPHAPVTSLLPLGPDRPRSSLQNSVRKVEEEGKTRLLVRMSAWLAVEATTLKFWLYGPLARRVFAVAPSTRVSCHSSW